MKNGRIKTKNNFTMRNESGEEWRRERRLLFFKEKTLSGELKWKSLSASSFSTILSYYMLCLQRIRGAPFCCTWLKASLILFNVASCLILQNVLDLFSLSRQTLRSVCVGFQHVIKQDNGKHKGELSRIEVKMNEIRSR